MVVAVFLAIAAALYAFRGYGVAEAILGKIVCAIKGPGECLTDGTELDTAYGHEIAELVKKYTPNLVYESGTKALPVDFRVCRDPQCADGEDTPGSMERGKATYAVTAYSRVVDLRKQGKGIYFQYWLYYANSFSGAIGRPLGSDWPGYHRDDWESVQVRVDSADRAQMRASAHDGYQGCKQYLACHNEWADWTSWSRVSGGSHAGHIVTGPGNERYTPANRIHVVPLETLEDRGSYSFAITPPWGKHVYENPELNSTD